MDGLDVDRTLLVNWRAVANSPSNARKLLRLARIRRAARGESMEGFKFRFNDKKLRHAVELARRIEDSQWAVVRFKSGIEISTRRLAPGLRLDEEPGMTMVAGDGGEMKGYPGLLIDKRRGFVKGEVPLVSIPTEKGDLEPHRHLFPVPDKPSGLKILTKQSKAPFPVD